jgi:hypothetical protein
MQTPTGLFMKDYSSTLACTGLKISLETPLYPFLFFFAPFTI